MRCGASFTERDQSGILCEAVQRDSCTAASHEAAGGADGSPATTMDITASLSRTGESIRG